MSRALSENGSYLKLLLESHPKQQKALLDTASKQQVDLLSEILYNLLYVVPIDEAHRKRLLKKSYLKDIAKHNRSYAYRKRRIITRKLDLIKLLMTYSHELLQLL